MADGDDVSPDTGSSDTVSAVSQGTGLSGDDLARYISRTWQIESGGNPYAQTGSQRGLGQWSPYLERQYGINDQNRTDPNVQATALATEANQHYQSLSRVLGRPPTPAELYFAHQQGLGGATAHFSNPDAPAWQNMAGTDEGRQKGSGWARQAIWGNIPDNPNTSPNFNKTMFPGGVDSVTSRDFANGWFAKFNGGPGATMTPAVWTPGASQPRAFDPTGAVAQAPGATPTPVPRTQDAEMAKLLTGGGLNLLQQGQQPHPVAPMAPLSVGQQSPFSPAAMALRQAMQRIGGPGGGPPIGAALPRVPSVQERIVAMLAKQRGMPQQGQG